jgi:hypothetical protein
MPNYEIIGWKLPSCTAAVEKLLLVLRTLTLDVMELSVEAHFENLDALTAFAKSVTSSRYACYCWTPIEGPYTFLAPEYRAIGKARIVFNERTITVDAQSSLPPYDWDGRPSALANVAYSEKHIEPVQTNFEERSEQIARAVGEIAQGFVNAREQAEVGIASAGSGGIRECYYWVRCPEAQLPPFLKELAVRFNLASGVGSFEFLGSPDQIRALHVGRKYQLTNFPPDCWSFNSGTGKTPFAIERASFLYPVLNIKTTQLDRVSRSIEELNGRLPICRISRKYVSWKLGPSIYSPRTQGNYALVSKQKTGYRIFIGFEQYADGDPTLRDFKSAAGPALKALGSSLKSVPYAV